VSSKQQTAANNVLGTAFWLSAVGCRPWADRRMPDAGCRMPDAEAQ
jgi:hypothetical protein